MNMNEKMDKITKVATGEVMQLIHLLSAPIDTDNDQTEEDWEREELLSSCLVEFENKYGSKFLADISDAIDEIAWNVAEDIVNGNFNNDY